MEKLTGIVRDNPTKKLPDGTIMSFEAVRLNTLPREGFSEISDLSSFQGACLAVCGSTHDATFVCGSAVLIAPGVAITAKHVIEGILKKANWQDGQWRIALIGGRGDGLIIWSATRIEMLNDSDLAIVSVKLASDLPKDGIIKVCEVSAREPDINEMVCLSGFRATATEFESSPKQANLELNFYVRTGHVTVVQKTERISALISSPCFEVAAGTLDGMSGGPAFDQQGRVLGIISTGDDNGPSYVTLLWPFLHTPLISEWPEEAAPIHMTLVERANSNRAFIEGAHRVLKHTSPQTEQVVVQLLSN